MSDAHEPAGERETEVLPAVGSGEDIVRTRELPVVEDETVVTAPPAQAETVVAPPVQAETVVASPARAEAVVAPPAPSPSAAPSPAPSPSAAPSPAPQPPPAQAETVVAPPPPAPSPSAAPSPAPQPPPAPAPAPRPAVARSGRGSGWRNAFLALVAVLLVAGVAGVVVARGRSGTATRSASGSRAAVAVPAAVTSFDPSGGSGFRQESGSTWRTQTYQTAQFGNLKEGVGLVLDLGSAREVSTVDLDVVGGPIGVELRAGDERAASAGGYQKVASADSASGPTTLTPAKDAGKHRYWLVWVTRLASQDGGYRAVIRDPAVRGPAS